MAFDQNPANAISEPATLKGKTLAELHVERKETCEWCESYKDWWKDWYLPSRKRLNETYTFTEEQCPPIHYCEHRIDWKHWVPYKEAEQHVISDPCFFCGAFTRKQEDNLPASENNPPSA